MLDVLKLAMTSNAMSERELISIIQAARNTAVGTTDPSSVVRTQVLLSLNP